MKIAMLGTRGVPARYSGFETAVEEIGARLAARGHKVTVYCRSHMVKYQGRYYKDMRLVKLPTIPQKHLDTIVHTGVSTLHMLARDRCDVALYFIAGNSPWSFVPRLAGIPTAINVDGLDSRRQKWNSAAKTYLRFAEWLAPHAATVAISDSKNVQRYYREKFGAETVFIPYGAKSVPAPGIEWLDKFGLKPREYFLFVGRLVPENCAHILIEAFRQLSTGKKLVIVGDAPYADDYIPRLKQNAPDNIIFTGYLFGEGYWQLNQNAFVFVVPTVVGGTHPVIVEAMAAGNCVVVSDHPPNLETVGDAGLSFDARAGAPDLQKQLQKLLDSPGLVEDYRRRSQEHARQNFDWEVVADRYEDICRRLLKRLS